ncbi:MAG: insulinase family protein [Desulfohalobiaceae bacterium]|nr:insulinase family protein [Desulfohalobiaceae bacterium]
MERETDYGFELIWSKDIKELQGRASLYRYRKNGAELLSIENSDENKVFGISFCTPPRDSTGVAHILEHSVLCGSRKYPLKEPFVELLKGSVQTFLNALTFPDKTCYPVASQNSQDFYNLIDVYLDAVFYPLISSEILAQEGQHLEYDEQQSSLFYQGVVYNEMKGAYSSPDSLLSEFSQQSLFPDSPYGLDSGGHPEKIPDLTYEQFREFHRTHYHPSNARIFFYGDDDPRKRLALLNEYLQDFEKIDVDSNVSLQPRFSHPRRTEVFYPSDDEQGKGCMLTLNWLLDVSTNSELNILLNILETLLISMPASPLRKVLLDSGLGEDLAGVGLESDLRQMYFSAGMKGIAKNNLSRVEELILTTLADLADRGFDAAMIEAAVNSVEFDLRENNTGSMPRGLVVMFRALSTWLYNGDPVQLLAYEQHLEAVKGRLAGGERVFEQLVDRLLVQNNHRTTVILKPDMEKGRELERRERSKLNKLALSLDDAQKRDISQKAKKLKELQERPDSTEDLAKIPRLKREDLDPQAPVIPMDEIDGRHGKIIYHDLDTNGVVYLDLVFDLQSLPQKYLGYVPLFGRALTEMGTESEDFVSLDQRIQSRTGGIHPETFASSVDESREQTARLFLRGKVMLEKVKELTDIYSDILNKVLLDNPDRFKQIVLEEKSRMEQRLIPAGHQVVNTRLRSKFSLSDWFNEHVNGISYLLFLRYLAGKISGNWPEVLSDLQQVKEQVINRKNLLVNLTVEEPGFKEVNSRIEDLLSGLPERSTERREWLVDCESDYEGLQIPSRVNYVGKGIDLYSLGYIFQPSCLVVNRYLRSTWLWDKLRVQGGAYGAFSIMDRLSGVLSFVSYRDPSIQETLKVYDQTASFLEKGNLDRAEIEKGVIGTIGDLDRYQLPDAKGMTSLIRHLVNDTQEKQQDRRTKILNTSRDDFLEFASWLSRINEHGKVVVLGDETQLSKAVENGLSLDHVWKVL